MRRTRAISDASGIPKDGVEFFSFELSAATKGSIKAVAQRSVVICATSRMSWAAAWEGAGLQEKKEKKWEDGDDDIIME